MISFKHYPFVNFNNNDATTGIFTKKHLINKTFICDDKNTLFTTIKQNKIAPYNSLLKRKNNGYFLEIIFNGFNFNAKRIKLRRLKYYIDGHRSETFIFKEKVSSAFKSKIHKKRLIFFSYNNDILHELKKVIKNIRTPNAYTGKGFYADTDIYKIKQRKKRK